MNGFFFFMIETYCENGFHSPDRSGNPFMAGFAIKDCNG
ncbi:hypothetical protein RC62_1166 [Flavobacterium aquidurense]|uniref:Uncharacterized protein n=1 Tax=Flavobacterium aquidurense TaxID=362413 RepID=A0A0Q0W527_9FLAO|nr:hypothetical protein RC62_1166 [Flavobacterium aquidurense]